MQKTCEHMAHHPTHDFFIHDCRKPATIRLTVRVGKTESFILSTVYLCGKHVAGYASGSPNLILKQESIGYSEADRVWAERDMVIEDGLDRGEFSQEEINRLGDIGERLDNWNMGVFDAAATKFDDGPHQSRYREALEDAARQVDHEDQQSLETELRNA